MTDFYNVVCNLTVLSAEDRVKELKLQELRRIKKCVLDQAETGHWRVQIKLNKDAQLSLHDVATHLGNGFHVFEITCTETEAPSKVEISWRKY